MQGADKFPNYINQKSVTKTDFHPKPFDINDYVEERSLQKGMNPYYSKEISTILSSLRQKSSKKHLENKHTDLEKNVNDTNCTFLRAMQAVDWKNPEPIPKTMYETDLVRNVFAVLREPLHRIQLLKIDKPHTGGMIYHSLTKH
ncbi:uncharacterized protein TNCT_356211 [Trichonephila clavata]|uniref:Uncharacterized protein n=1 Tax=Trichonephila clavata TaxID=2740835 RepID=A0A8X6FHX5_TRICU|nr:uncharacterized protein TNCT_356211 [Trichonephila clavata]